MAEEVRIAIPALYGGISQQPAHLRFPHQVEDAVNILFDVAEGASKRPGTVFICRVDDLLNDGDYRLYSIERDQDEKYFVVYGEGVIRVFHTDGLECDVTASQDAIDYINAENATADDLQLITIEDYTIILNRKVQAKGKASPDYTVDGTHNDYDALISYTPSGDGSTQKGMWDLTNGVGERHRVESTDATAEEYYYYDPDPDQSTPANKATFAHVVFGTVKGAWARPSGYYKSERNPGGFKITWGRNNIHETNVSWTAADKKLTKTGAFTGYDWQVGDQIWVAGGSGGITPDWYTIAYKESDDAIVLETSLTSSDVNDVEIGATGSPLPEKARIKNSFEAIIDVEPGAFTDMDDVAKEFQDALRADGAFDALVSWVDTGEGAAEGHFVITCSYRGETAEIFGTEAPSSGYDYTGNKNRPFFWDDATSHKGTGTPTTLTLAPEDRWTSTAPPNQPNAMIDETTMPIKLVRTAVRSGDTPAQFTLSTIDWSARASGDENNNPIPSIWENQVTISDITLHRNRLVLAGDEYIVFSQAGDLFNFYLDNANNVVDSDPIDLTLTSHEVTIIDYIVPFRKTLIIFTKAGSQFELNTPDNLTAETAAIEPSTTYKSLSVKPRTIGNLLYFIGLKSGTTALYEYFYNDSRVANEAADTTSHTPHLLPAEIRSIAVSANDNCVFVIPKDDNRIFMYRFHWSGLNKDQSAWTTYVFDDSYRIADATMISTSLYMLVETTDGFNIETIDNLNYDDPISPRDDYETDSFPTTWTKSTVFTGLINVIGGASAPSTYLTDNDQHNVATDSWSTKTAIPTRGSHDARSLPQTAGAANSIYILGGNASGAVPNCDKYDSTDSWTALPDLSGDYLNYNGYGGFRPSYVYTFGGYNGLAPQQAAAKSDETSWITLADMPETARGGGLKAMADYYGNFYMACGVYKHVYKYQISGDSWSTQSSSMPFSWVQPGCAILHTRFYFFGGYDDDSSQYVKTSRYYHPSTDSWVSVSDIPGNARQDIAAAYMNGNIYIYGGHDATTYYRDAAKLSLGAWSSMTDLPAPGRSGAAAKGIR